MKFSYAPDSIGWTMIIPEQEQASLIEKLLMALDFACSVCNTVEKGKELFDTIKR